MAHLLSKDAATSTLNTSTDTHAQMVRHPLLKRKHSNMRKSLEFETLITSYPSKVDPASNYRYQLKIWNVNGENWVGFTKYKVNSFFESSGPMLPNKRESDEELKTIKVPGNVWEKMSKDFADAGMLMIEMWSQDGQQFWPKFHIEKEYPRHEYKKTTAYHLKVMRIKSFIYIGIAKEYSKEKGVWLPTRGSLFIPMWDWVQASYNFKHVAFNIIHPPLGYIPPYDPKQSTVLDNYDAGAYNPFTTST